MTTACPEHEVSKLKVLLQYLRQSLGGPLTNLTFVFLTPTLLPNIIRIHSRVFVLCCLQESGRTRLARYRLDGKRLRQPFSNTTFLSATATQIPNIIKIHTQLLELYAVDLHIGTQDKALTENITFSAKVIR